MNKIEQALLEKISGLHKIPTGKLLKEPLQAKLK